MMPACTSQSVSPYYIYKQKPHQWCRYGFMLSLFNHTVFWYMQHRPSSTLTKEN